MSTPSVSPSNPPTPGIELDGAVRGRVRLLGLWIDSVEVSDDAWAFQELCAQATTLRGRWAGSTVGQVPGIEEARRLYRAFQIDPTKTRPSSEALLRRALKGLELFHVDNVVDAANLVSLATLLSLGLYDRDAIVGSLVTLRVGKPGEQYAGIRKSDVHVEGRLTVADANGPFGSPTSDSFRTRIRSSTTRLVAIVFAPADGELSRLSQAGSMLADGLARFAKGREVYRSVLA